MSTTLAVLTLIAGAACSCYLVVLAICILLMSIEIDGAYNQKISYRSVKAGFLVSLEVARFCVWSLCWLAVIAFPVALAFYLVNVFYAQT